MVGIIAAIVLVVSAAGGGTALAAQGSLPGDTLYPVKLGTERMALAFPGNAVSKAEQALGHAENRVQEFVDLSDRGRPQHLDLAAEKYDEAMARAVARMNATGENGQAAADVSELVSEATSGHVVVLDMVYDNVPDDAKEAIEKARGVSLRGHTSALAALAGHEPPKAAEMYLVTAEGRLNRAMTAAEENDAAEVDNALGHVEELHGFGETISEIARGLGDTATVADLVAMATSHHLSVLDQVRDSAPEQARPAIERAREASMHGLGHGLTALAGENPRRAMELNLAAMEGRLNRIEATAADEDVEGVEDAVEEFEELAGFGEEISELARQIGEDVTQVDELVARATSLHLEVLEKVLDMVPDEAKPAIERAMERSQIGHERAVQALERRGPPDETPGPNGPPATAGQNSQGVGSPGGIPTAPGVSPGSTAPASPGTGSR